MSDKDRLALILDVISNGDKFKKNIAELQAAIAKHEDAREKSTVSQAEAEQVINQANSVRSQIFEESSALDDEKAKHENNVKRLDSERANFEENKKVHAGKVSSHEEVVKIHNASVQRFEVDKKAHDAKVETIIKNASKAEEDARKAIAIADQRVAESLAIKKVYEDKLASLRQLAG